MRYVIRAVPEREGPWHDYLRERLPDAEWCYEEAETRGAAEFTATLARALRMQGTDGAVHLDDDVVLTTDFDAKVRRAVGPYWASVVQLFSMRKDHVRPSWASARRFIHGPCFYLPGSMAPDLADFHEWIVARGLGRAKSYVAGERVDQGFAIGAYLRERGLSYRIHSPSLVQHRAGPSSMGHQSRLSGNAGDRPQQSPTFVDPDAE